MKYQPLVLIGEAEKCFDEQYTLPSIETDFKFLIIEEPNELPKLLLMLLDKPFRLHAQALNQYMDDKGISNIIVRGGGYIRFYEDGSIGAFGTSFAFKSAVPEQLESCISVIWPSADVNTDDLEHLPDHDFKYYHRSYSIDKIAEEAKKE